MTDDRDNSPAETETWEKGRSGDGSWIVMAVRGWSSRVIATCFYEADADAIIAARAKAGRVRELEAIRAAALNLLAGGNGVGEDAMGELFIHDEGRLLDHLCLLAEALLATEGNSGE